MAELVPFLTVGNYGILCEVFMAQHLPPEQQQQKDDDAPQNPAADEQPQDTESKPLSFADRWRGKFVLADDEDPRYTALVKKYLQCG